MVDQVITTQELIDAQKDAQTLEEVVNGPANTNVTSRLGRIFPTLATLAQTIFTTSVVMEGNKTQQQINADFSTADENIEAALSEKKSISNKGAPNGYLGLDENGKATAGQLPAATETALGVVELATQTEVNTGTDDERAVTPKKLKAISFGQTGSYADVTASRLGDTLYTNTKNVPLVVAITAGAQASTNPNKSSIICGGLEALYVASSAGSFISTQLIVVPVGGSYKLNNPLSIVKWMEW